MWWNKGRLLKMQYNESECFLVLSSLKRIFKNIINVVYMSKCGHKCGLYDKCGHYIQSLLNAHASNI